MKIANDRPIRELQTEFSSKFPFLEISFFRPNDTATMAERPELSLRVGDIRRSGSNGSLHLRGDFPPTAIEQTIEDVFGLRSKIGYRKGLHGHCGKAAKTLRELNLQAMRLAESVVFV